MENNVDYTTCAKRYIKLGYSVIPVSESKMPTITSWVKYQTRVMTEEEAERHFNNAKGIAILCGGESRVFCLDIDLKYDLTKDLWDRFKKAVPADILKKLVCQKTKNGGYHLIFIAPKTRLVGNEKFASRYTTPEEKHITYMEAFRNHKTRDKALNIALQDKSRILFESRSGKPEACGGYFLISPSPGYEVIYGSKFAELSEKEYDTLIDTTRSFNEVLIEDKHASDPNYNVQWKVNPFEQYNKEGDIEDLLGRFGWTQILSRGTNLRFKRPGHTHTKDSAILDASTRIFNVFTTSTSFDVGKGYSPSGVFIHLECDDDTSVGYRKLIELGFGIKE